MKPLFTLVICSILFVSCKVTKVIHDSTSDEFSPKLFHKYDAASTAHAESQFKPLRRVVEFNYDIIERDSIVEVAIMLTSGFNEGDILDHLDINLQNEESVKIEYQSHESRDYVETYSYNYTRPVNNTQTVTDPGGVDIVTKPDGTVEHVHRPASTKTVYSNEHVAQTNQGSKSQIFNSAKILLEKDDIALIKTNGVENFEVFFQNSSLILTPNKQQARLLKGYLTQ